MYLQYKPLEDKPIAQYPVRKEKCRFWCDEDALRCAPTARVASGGRFHPESCRLIW
jgi:hypothetical protein